MASKIALWDKFLIRRFIHKPFKDGQKNDFDIEPKTPFTDVLKVELNAFFHLSAPSR